MTDLPATAALPEPVGLCHLPTPLEHAPGLEKWLGGPRLLLKRDDCTGFALGGNKGRKLEFIFAEAQAKGADTVLTAAGLQSNHCRQTAAAAARLGMEAHLLLLHMVQREDAAYRDSGNVLLDRLFGATIHAGEPGLAPADQLAALAQTLEKAGRRPFVIEFGGSTPLGAQGYLRAAEEILADAAAMGERVDHIVHASGSGGTQAGLVAGLAGRADAPKVHGISVLRTDEGYIDDILAIALGAAALAGRPAPTRADVRVAFEEVAPGYGEPNPATLEAMAAAARTEGLVLDPVYTGKGLAGLKRLVATGTIGPGETVVFLHTGGAPGLFAYPSLYA